MLSEIFNKYNCDKSSKHKYDLIYENLFENRRFENLNILEIGIFKGNSIKAWLEYFPNATIYAIDIFTRIDSDNIEILNHPRVKWSKCDSTDKAETQLLWNDIKFDFIIDDGLHFPNANRKTFENFYDRLNENGLFIIEDVFPWDEMTSKDKNNHWVKSNISEFNDQNFDLFYKTINQYKVKRYDNRKITNQPDSYIMVISEEMK
jgi:hypothetical protein